MTMVAATPDDVQDKLGRAQPGDHVLLRPGTYRQRLVMEGRKGTAAAPIVIQAEPGAVLDGSMTADSHRIEANRLALDVWDGTVKDVPAESYPGLWPWMRDGQLSLRNCRHVELLDLHVESSWPTLVALENCREIRIRRGRFLDGAFAIGALGGSTGGILIEDCAWTQDRVPGRMWRELNWAAIHGDPSSEEDGPVKVQEDWRLFDGDFFRGDGIAGGVRILRCEIDSAFNAIHLFNDADDPDLARDIEVAYCTFRDIRDNVFEPETSAHNWWFHHNLVRNSHKCFSLEQKRSGDFYIFANRLWYDSLQGPDDDKHRGGSIIKPAKSLKPSSGQHHFFHNSIYAKSTLLQNGLLARFQFANNAIRFARPGDPAFAGTAGVFGDLAASAQDIEHRFTSDWRQLGISMGGDVVDHPSWPGEVLAAGYPIGPGLGADPLFRDPFSGDFALRPGSPCLARATALEITFPNGSSWRREAGGDVGAMQGEELLAGPEFVATAIPVA